jgi:pseudo-rSAM protein
MKENDPIYWFYLEPYTFLFYENERFLVYNTLNGAAIRCGSEPEVQTILLALHQSDKNYCVSITQGQVEHPNVIAFINEVRSSFSGDIAPYTATPPLIFKPLLRLYSHPGDLHEKRENLLGFNSLLYLHEVTFYLENRCTRMCTGCADYHKQFSHCTQTDSQVLQPLDYKQLFDQLALCQLDQINLVLGETINWELLETLIVYLRDFPFKKVIHLQLSDLMNGIIEKLNGEGFQFKISAHFPTNQIEELNSLLIRYTGEHICWQFVVSNEEGLHQLDQLKIATDVKTVLTPYFDGTNQSFFEKYIYNDWEDITEKPIEKQVIFRRQVLNENFFGKLVVFPSGTVYANMNMPPIGNLTSQKLTEIVYNEISDSTVWLKTRTEGACKTCINKYLCPSPSNYEMVMNKYDLCTINNTKLCYK